VLAVLIGTGRNDPGDHDFTHVVGGLLAGTAWLLLVTRSFPGLSVSSGLERWR
jgi:hypothetical protein